MAGTMTPSDPIERYLARLRAGLHVPRRKPSSSWPRRRITCARLALLRERSGGTFDLPEGTIYPALHRLEDSGLLVSSWAQAEGRRRRVYGLTDKGVTALAAQHTEWRKFATGMRAVIGWSASSEWRPSGGRARVVPGWSA
jgi:hypothetical protein